MKKFRFVFFLLIFVWISSAFSRPLKAESLDLQNESGESVPEYVISEAQDVIERINKVKNDHSFVLAVIADMHYDKNQYTDGIQHAAQALAYIDEHVGFDAMAVLGDYTDGYHDTDHENAMADYKAVNELLTIGNLRFVPNLRLLGNREFCLEHSAEMQEYIQSYCRGVNWADAQAGYGYRDFEKSKIRFVLLNTIETNIAKISCTPEQYRWFAEVLDLSDKEDFEEWQIAILSHHPVDWNYSDDSYAFVNTLNAYQTGTSYSDEYVSCDFSNGKNAAKLIANFHSHIHNLMIDNVHLQNNANKEKTDVFRIASPEASINRQNLYWGQWRQEKKLS